jgi:hypothetical protein
MLAPNPDASLHADDAFAVIPFVPGATMSRAPNRWRRFVVCTVLGVLATGTAVAYLFRPMTDVDSNAPRVRVEVHGMHCPIQCGLRVASALETLPWVVRGSVTTNSKTGVVTFAVTDMEAVQEAEIRRVIETAGFGVLSVTAPGAPTASDGPDARR